MLISIQKQFRGLFHCEKSSTIAVRQKFQYTCLHASSDLTSKQVLTKDLQGYQKEEAFNPPKVDKQIPPP
jgi:hypothetical protein